MDRHSLPNELIYKILVAPLGYSILDICTLGPHTPLLVSVRPTPKYNF